MRIPTKRPPPIQGEVPSARDRLNKLHAELVNDYKELNMALRTRSSTTPAMLDVLDSMAASLTELFGVINAHDSPHQG